MAMFSKRLKDLEVDQLAVTEDFFSSNSLANEDAVTDTMTTLQRSSNGRRHTIEAQYTGDHIDDEWLDESVSYDGQLSVDVFQTETAIIITSAVAGLRSKDLDISMNGDMITIKGIRKPPFNTITDDDYFIRECYWGGFSRSIILPVDIQHDSVNATLENGILTITLPKATYSRNGKIRVIEQ